MKKCQTFLACLVCLAASAASWPAESLTFPSLGANVRGATVSVQPSADVMQVQAPEWIVWRAFYERLISFAKEEPSAPVAGQLAWKIGLGSDQAATLKRLGEDFLEELVVLEAAEQVEAERLYRARLPPALIRALREPDQRPVLGPPSPILASSPRAGAEVDLKREEEKGRLLAAHQLLVANSVGDSAYNAIYRWIQDNVAPGVSAFTVNKCIHGEYKGP